jgi:ornithine cyclodeaminase
VEIVKAKDEESLVRESGLVVTATPSLQPPIKPEWLHQGLHITTVGSDAPEKQELFADVIGQADILVCDLKSQTFVRGEFHHVLESGIISPDDEITELGELVSSQKVVRENPLQISICDLTGVGVQDTMIARFAYQKAVSAGLSVKI